MYWDNITEMAREQERKGLEHYGHRIEDNTDLVDPVQIITEAEQEIIDTLYYLEHLKARLKDAMQQR